MKMTYFVMPRQTGKTEKMLFEFLREPERCLFITMNEENKKYVRGKVQSIIADFPSKSKQLIQNQIIQEGDLPLHDLDGFVMGRAYIAKVFIDEYAFFTDGQKFKILELIHALKRHEPKGFNFEREIIISTSVNHQYNYPLYDIVREFKKEQYAECAFNGVPNTPIGTPRLKTFMKQHFMDNLSYSDSFLQLISPLSGNVLFNSFYDEHSEQIKRLLHNAMTEPICNLIDPSSLYMRHEKYRKPEITRNLRHTLGEEHFEKEVMNKLFHDRPSS